MKLVVGAKTDVGLVRQGNEDSYLAEAPLFAVADGMGGHLAGDVASTTAVEVIVEHLKDDLAEDPQKLAEILRAANKTIWEKASSDASLRGMGTTCTMVLIDGSTAHVAHVGDSRAYLVRDGQLEQITTDHTLVERMVKEGRLTAEEASHHPQRNIITNALGIDADVDVDLFSLELHPGDRVIICSDGLSSMVDDDEIQSLAADGSDPQSSAEAMIQAALDAGGEDNITVIILDAAEGDGVEAPAPPPPPTTAPREDTEPEATPRGGGGSSRWGRRLLFGILALLLVAGALYATARYTLSNSWFVGINEEGFVTIFRGIPEEIAGVELKEVEEETTIAIADLPTFMRSDFREGRKVDSLDDAEETVANLEERVRDQERTSANQKKNASQP
jgi:PPM family protein phosphatase